MSRNLNHERRGGSVVLPGKTSTTNREKKLRKIEGRPSIERKEKEGRGNQISSESYMETTGRSKTRDRGHVTRDVHGNAGTKPSFHGGLLQGKSDSQPTKRGKNQQQAGGACAMGRRQARKEAANFQKKKRQG